MLCVAKPAISPSLSLNSNRRTRNRLTPRSPSKSPQRNSPQYTPSLKPEAPAKELNFQDVYESMDAEQRVSSRQQRRRIIEYAQKRAASSSSMQIPNLPDDQQSLVSLSRPPTAYSFKSLDCNSDFLNESGDREAMSSPLRSSSVMTLRTWSTQSKLCARTRSAMDRDLEHAVTRLSRQCCDVLGPKTCHQCAMIQKRKDDTERQEASSVVFPNLHASEANFSTAMMVSRVCPKLDAYQVQTKIVCGEINNPGIRSLLERRRQMMKEEKEKKAVEERTKKTFRNLKTRISSKCLVSNMKSALNPDAAHPKASVRIMSFSELVNPAFISLKNIPPEKEPVYRAFYEPPLLPKSCQNAEPSFFAGKDDQYKLPDIASDDASEENDS